MRDGQERPPQRVGVGERSGRGNGRDVREYSGYYLSLTALNERFKKAGNPAVKLVTVPNALEDEDILEMLNAGILTASVVDNWKAKIWAQIPRPAAYLGRRGIGRPYELR